MQAATVSQHGGSLDEVVRVANGVVKPALRRGKGEMVVRVLACALAPGDVRVWSGECDLMQSPGFFPYIPGGDVCGVVEDVEPGAPFKVGDVVISMFGPSAAGPGPAGGLAEYAVVGVKRSTLKPPSLSPLEGAALASSGLTAFTAAAKIRPSDRVLVLGGAGGVGSSIVQLARRRGASFVAATSTQRELVASLGAHVVHDYTREEWWTLPAYKAAPFDIVFDCVGGLAGWPTCSASGAVKSASQGGRWITIVPDEPNFHIHSVGQALGHLRPILGRAIASRAWPPTTRVRPRYTYHLGIDPVHLLGATADAAAKGEFKVVLDSASPLPFTADGVLKAFHLQRSKHAHGKLVVQVAPHA
ncbi:hypothetical protein KFE25_000550 [Diacronema lutheri]|uniref:Enoyl reductase (ER) domain-containing protein n=2 Tax=Diacronema lutheri TaxID=2081491 RepID=A0A8J5XNX8_DIALT|nr:hypothetical protein KFE25_000550 [Diacronema lutheri]